MWWVSVVWSVVVVVVGYGGGSSRFGRKRKRWRKGGRNNAQQLEGGSASRVQASSVLWSGWGEGGEIPKVGGVVKEVEVGRERRYTVGRNEADAQVPF